MPEVSGKEFKTSEYIAAELKSMGLEIKFAHTGIISEIKGRQGAKTVAFRADFDGLPITENTGCEYASVNGNMHACGHDGHTAMLLGAAKYLTENPPLNNVRLIFQYGEEGEGGATTMIANGATNGVDNIFAFHLCPELEKGKVGTNRGALFAGVVEFDLTAEGLSSHCATREEGKDALAALIETVYKMRDFEKGKENVLLHVGKLSGGNARNIVSSRAIANCTFRYYDEVNRQLVLKEIGSLLTEMSQKYGVKLAMTVHTEYPPLINHPDSVDILEKVTELQHMDGRYTAEDFAFYLKEVSGCMAWLGIRDSEHIYPLHSDKFNFDENVLKKGTEIFIKLADI